MKKTILFMCVCIFAITIFCVPCLASEVEYEKAEYNGIFIFDTTKIRNIINDVSGVDSFDLNFTANGIAYTKIRVNNIGGYKQFIYETADGSRALAYSFEKGWEKGMQVVGLKGLYYVDIIDWLVYVSGTYVELVGTDVFSDILSKIREQISVSTVVAILVQCVTVSVGLVFLWWGARKATGALIKAFKKGKIRI